MQALFSSCLIAFLTILTKSLIAHDPFGPLHPDIGSGTDLISEPSPRSESGGCASITGCTYSLDSFGADRLTSKANAAPGATSLAG